MNEVDTREYLIANDPDFRRLAEQHRSYERQLRALQRKPFLNDHEEMERTVIKKKKLALKDQMQVLILRHRTQESV